MCRWCTVVGTVHCQTIPQVTKPDQTCRFLASAAEYASREPESLDLGIMEGIYETKSHRALPPYLTVRMKVSQCTVDSEVR